MTKKLTPLFFYVFIFCTTSFAQTMQIWGNTFMGGERNGGVIYKFNLGGTGFDTVYSLGKLEPDGLGLCQSSNGKLYGTAESDSDANIQGAIFNFNPSNNNFNYSVDTGYFQPSGGCLTLANDGNLYNIWGLDDNAGGTHILRFNPDSDTYSNAYTFASITNGGYAGGQLLQATDGLLYGMTLEGGTFNDGVLFSFDPSTTTFNKLHDFTGTDGEWPSGNLIQYGNELYGVTGIGGDDDNGVIYSYNTATNLFAKLYDFSFNTGGAPDDLVRLSNGVLYGTTQAGGSDSEGVIFNYNVSTNTYNDLYNFINEHTYGSILLASDSLIYGTTFDGGANNDGTIFSFDPANSNYNVVYNFDGIHGASPGGVIIEIAAPTGINQLSVNNNQLSVYPNPTEGSITITSTKNIDEIKVTNLLGQLIYQSNPKQLQTTFDIKDEGIYFVTITCGDEITTRKVVVSK